MEKENVANNAGVSEEKISFGGLVQRASKLKLDFSDSSFEEFNSFRAAFFDTLCTCRRCQTHEISIHKH